MSFIPLANPLPTSDTIANAGDVIDTANSSTTPLGISGVFTGAWVNTLGYAQISVLAFADVISAANGLQIEFSSDGTHVDHTHTYQVYPSVGETIQVQTHSVFYRVVYTNGAVAQTAFRLQSILRPMSALGTVLEVDDVPTQFDDALLTKSIIVGQNTQSSAYVNVKVTPDGGLSVNQNTAVDTLNSSTTNLAAGATFTGTGVTDLAYDSIQWNLIADQNCIVYVDQSSDGTHWDIVDSFAFYAALGGNAQTVSLIASWYRVRVQNIGSATTTFFRLQTIAVPFQTALPRSLDSEGYLQVGIKSIMDQSGFRVRHAPHGEMLTAESFRLVGTTFTQTTIDSNFWTALTGTGGTVSIGGGTVTMSTGTTANNTTSLTSVYNARFVVGRINNFKTYVRLGDTGTINNVRRGGAYTSTDGAFFEISGTTFSIVTRKGGIDTKVTNGSFNGIYGPTFTIDTNFHVYELMYHPEAVYFFADEKLLHTVHTTTSAWTSNLHLPINYENFNINGSTTNVTMQIAFAIIHGLGKQSTQPIGKFLTSGTTVVKYGTGNAHGITLSNIANGATVTLYDNTAGSGTILWASGALTVASQSNNFPFDIDFSGIQFNVGLTVVITGTVSVLIKYE